VRAQIIEGNQVLNDLPPLLTLHFQGFIQLQLSNEAAGQQHFANALAGPWLVRGHPVPTGSA
jgi:hypothetical protein